MTRLLSRALLIFLAAACVPSALQLQDAAPDAALQDAEAIDAEIEDADVEDAREPDAQPDADQPDADPPDAAAPSHCPSGVNPACASAMVCGADIPPPTNCDSCVAANNALCADASCETPPVLDVADIYAIATQVDPTLPLLESIAGFAVASRTAGEAVVTCADVYAGRVDLSDRCYNVLDSKSINVSQAGDTYTVSFNGFASGQHTLFLLYGHETTGAGGPPVGLSCTEIDVGPPMGGSQMFFAGDRMRPL